MAGGHENGGLGFGAGEFTAQQSLDFAAADGAGGGRTNGFAESLDFLDDAGGKHGMNVAGDAVLQFRPVPDEEQTGGGDGGGLPKMGERLAGALHNFDGADDTAFVLKIHLGGSRGIRAVEAFPESSQIESIEFGATGGIGWRGGGKSLNESSKIQAGAAHHEGAVAPGVNAGDRGVGEIGVTLGVEGFRGRDASDEMVRHAAHVRRARLGREHRQAGINLKGVGTHDFRVEPFGKGESKGAFADSGGTGQIEGWGDRIFDSGFWNGKRAGEKKKGPL